ncbi:MAG: glutamate--cysteine ligase [Alphaproteobacteria bacterium]
MTTTPSAADKEIASKTELVEYLEVGCKPPSAWRIGTEHEKFAFRIADRAPLPYDGPAGVRALLEGLRAYGWAPVVEGDNVIALTQNGASVTLEPGGQLELSGAPLQTIHETCDEVNTHLAQVKEIGEKLGVGMLGLGFHPSARRDDIPWMPKGRYGIMRAYMPTRGDLGLDMMLRSCTIQVNLDFASESDMVTKMRIGLALQPVATALFANSPFTEGRPNGWLSYRSHLWTDTDPDRTGMLPFVFEDGMGFERYVDYALDVPMYFVYRDGRYIDAAGQSFRDFIDGRLPALPGERARLGDFIDHMTTIFPEVRLKQFLEMRGADGGPWARICALSALWVGLFYDDGARDAAWDLVKDFGIDEMAEVRHAVTRQALAAPFRGGTVGDLALRVLEISREGLRRRGRGGRVDPDETGYLDALDEIAASGRAPAEDLLAAFAGRWGGSVDPVFDELAY